MSHITVRTAVETDRSAVFILARGFATSFDVERNEFDTSFSQILLAEDAQLLVATNGDAVLGYCLAFDHRTFFANGRITSVEEIVVVEEARRSRIGNSLMNGVEQWAIDRKSSMVALATRRAAEFYSAIGYEESAVYFRKILHYGRPVTPIPQSRKRISQ